MAWVEVSIEMCVLQGWQSRPIRTVTCIAQSSYTINVFRRFSMQLVTLHMPIPGRLPTRLEGLTSFRTPLYHPTEEVGDGDQRIATYLAKVDEYSHRADELRQVMLQQHLF